MKTWSTSLIIKELQMKIKHHLSCIRPTKIKNISTITDVHTARESLNWSYFSESNLTIRIQSHKKEYTVFFSKSTSKNSS